MKPRKRGQLAAVGGLQPGPIRESRPCPECRGPTDADARCPACRLYAVPHEPHRTCTGCGRRRWTPPGRDTSQAGLDPDGWCWGCEQFTGPRLERVATPEGWAYVEREVPDLMPREQVRALTRAFVAGFRDVPPPRPQDAGEAREPGEDREAEVAARKAELRRQAAALGVRR